MIRVLWVTKGLGPGGAEHLLAGSARSHDRSQFEIECAYVVPFKDHLVADLEASGVRCTCLSSHAGDRRWPVRLMRLIQSGDFDVVHVHAPLPGAVARVASRLPGAANTVSITTEHNAWSTYRLATRLVNGITSPLDKRTLAVSGESAESLRGPARTRSMVLTHGIDLSEVALAAENREQIRDELGLTPHDIVIGTIANFRHQKDYPNFLAAAKAALEVAPQLRFVAVGQGPLLEPMKQLATDLGIGGEVIFTGYRTDPHRLLAVFDVFTLASRWEGLPVALMEASALGLPTVATAVGGVAEVLDDDVNALLVPAGDSGQLANAWLDLATDDAKRSNLGGAIRELSGKFDVRQTQHAIESTYREVSRGTGNQQQSSRGKDSPTTRTRRAQKPEGEYQIRSMTGNDVDSVVGIIARSMNFSDLDRLGQLFRWKHLANPFGESPAWVAEDEQGIAAVRVFMRWEFERDGEILRAVRAVDTATDPRAQGQGLFTTLTLQGVDAMVDDGVDFVFNTPNDKSRPGYLKMGWRSVGALPTTVKLAEPKAVVPMARARVPAELWSEPLSLGCSIAEWLDNRRGQSVTAYAPPRGLTTRKSSDYLRWRYGSELLHYRVVDNRHGDHLVVRVRRRGAARELVVADVLRHQRPGASVRIPAALIQAARCDYAIRLGTAFPADGQLPLPGGGPLLTWRKVSTDGCPAAANWNLRLGDIELF